MLIQYEYEIISYIARNCVLLNNNNLQCAVEDVEDEFGNINMFLKSLQEQMLIKYDNKKIVINTETWIHLFVDLINREFEIYKINVLCRYNKRKFKIEFIINDVIKEFSIGIDCSQEIKYEIQYIYMYYANTNENGVYWLNLLNDRNLLYTFFAYLSNESDYLNKQILLKFDNFDGISDSIISEVFNVYIKEYLQKEGFNKYILNYDQEILVKKIFLNREISYYFVGKNLKKLGVVRDGKKIYFIELFENTLRSSKEIRGVIEVIINLLNCKISEYRKLIMIKECNLMENVIKVTSKAAIIFSPTTLIISLFGILDINIKNIVAYKYIIYSLIAILIFIQIVIGKLVYMPIFKIGKFKWDL